MTKPSEYYLKRTRAAAKEIEFEVPEDVRAKKDIRIEDLFPLVISYVGDSAYKIVSNNEILSSEDKLKLIFASKFLTSYILLRSGDGIETKYYAIGAAAGYLCDRVGDAALLASRINLDNCYYNPLFFTLVHILKNDKIEDLSYIEETYGYSNHLKNLINEYNNSLNNGLILNNEVIQSLKTHIYSNASDYELFIVDLLLAVCKIKCKYSTAAMIKEHNNISNEKKKLLLSNHAIIKEFWPAQRLMLEKGFFNGKSGIIQLPTGAGKTKSISLCVYSYFSSQEKNISIIVSPFKALCRETAATLKKDLEFDKSISVVELTDVLRSDYEISVFGDIKHKNVIVITPEKLLYVLRHEPDFAPYIGQIFFDEGHLFEDNNRGAKYELLVTSILLMLQDQPQIIMISAIISDIEKINQWISKGTGETISESNIATTEKYTASLSQQSSESNSYLYLKYLNNDSRFEEDFYVPRFIEQKIYTINKKDIVFPNDNREASIATLLRLVKHANCALFTGRKDFVNSIAQKIVNISNYIDVSSLSVRNNPNEQSKLINLILNNYGEESIYYKCSKLGVFLHHSGISEGIKASIEFALTQNNISNVICTSTLSQGVNLPIKFLIIDDIRQGKSPINKHDFKNLIGRVGRSGMFTEGTIIYTDYNAYNKKNWKWKQFVDLYSDLGNNCFSQLFLVKQYYEIGKDDQLFFEKLPILFKENIDDWNHIKEILEDIESFIAQWNEIDDKDIENLINRTLLLQSSGQVYGNRLAEVFRIIKHYLYEQIPNSEIRISYSKSLLSIKDYISLKNAVENVTIDKLKNRDEIQSWSMEQIYNLSKNRSLTIFNIDNVKQIANLWINGISYGKIFEKCQAIKVKHGTGMRNLKLEDISALCDKGFSYSATLVLNTIYELFLNYGDNYNEIANHISNYLLMLKYGLSDINSIYLYELGFNDRNIAQEIANQIKTPCKNKNELIQIVRTLHNEIEEILINYPEYYKNQFLQIISVN